MAEEQAQPRKAFAAMRKRIMHPLVSFGGNATFIYGAGTIVAGLVGGALAVLADFPTVWLVVTGVGAFMLTSGAIITFVPAARRNLQAEVKRSEVHAKEEQQRTNAELIHAENVRLRRAIRLIREELLDNKGTLIRMFERQDNALGQLAIRRWNENESVLLDHPDSTPHVAASEAYRHVGRLIAAQMWETPGGIFELRDDYSPPRDELVEASDAIAAAVTTLTKAEGGDTNK